MLDLLAKGGILVWPIAICSLTGWFIFFQKLLAFRSAAINQESNISKLITINSLEEAKKAAEKLKRLKTSRLAATDRLLIELLGAEIRDRETLEILMGHGVEREVKHLSTNLGTLATLGNISPLLGLLGTVVGMIKAFIVVEEMGGRVNAAILAGGIWEAMLTTAFGLIVAIPLMIFHSYLLGRLHDLQAGLEEIAVGIIKLWPSGKK